ncbi:NEL-type E3 ubiquitin ligase domain-containing protein [Pseudomonas fluorescens]|uniref:NEL-type E3 ubiquitin ligase domain-containing protein n=1 Tax=Pseudomonas fluorescens TaxID=294 RepID=UPI0012574E19|nr:NEL-type E3 ubiquitin ligase domain-containing protein [Pseudomonas fluorescens]VVM42914.1 hypothetical protein PS639_00370 [Pseudomonas fluorescens]
MSPKPPPRGTVTVDTHTRPSNGRTPQPDTVPRIDFGPSTMRPPGDPPGTGRTPGDTDIDAITPAPPVTVSATSSASDAALTPEQRPLEHYWITAAARLPDADAQGFRVFNGRRYVDVPDGGIVQIGADPQTGLYRARLKSELMPSGPVLARDPDSRLWHPRNDLESILFTLSDTRLEAFRTDLDFTGIEPDGDGLYRHDGKLYVVIHDHTYQALRDLDASSPQVPVMRIVRAQDPVARDEGNAYVATRPGRSEAVVLDPQDGWVGVNVAGPGGMRRGEQERPLSRTLADRFAAFANRLNRPESRARKLFPSFDDQQIAAYIQSLGEAVAAGLTRREAEYKTLKKNLLDWTRANAQPSSSTQPGTAKDWAELVAQEIKRCWRHETEARLKLPSGSGTLPALTADFSHVRALELNAVAWSDTADTFLAGFSGLERLTVTRSTLDKLPAAIAQMTNLSTLDLSSNGIRLNEQTAGTLSALGKLKNIDLSGNPLGKTPDFTGMSELKTLNLSNTQLNQWPAGLQHQTSLEIVDLRNNQLHEVPQAILNPPADQLESSTRVNGVTLIEGNPFPAGYWKTLERYWQRVAADQAQLSTNALPGAFRLDGDIPEIAMVQRMHPDKNAQEAREFLFGLGDEAEAALARRAQDLDLLEAQLQAYIADRRPGGSTVNTPEEIWAQRVARVIKGCWLGDSGEMLSLPPGSGPLPALTVDFSHVKILSLQTIAWSDAADTFLSNFPNLEILSINHCGLEKLPAKIGDMDKLRLLNLSTNHIELDEQSAARLSALSQLTIINLSHNPTLKMPPDFSLMSGLIALELSNTGISQWPTGLRDKTALNGLNLSNNRLREVPEEFLNPAPEHLPAIARINGATLLEGNEFPSGYWRKFDDYWRRLNTAHPELMDPVHPAAFDSDNSRAQRYRSLYPRKSIKECREYIWSLEEGTAHARLSSLEEEFGVLKSQLDAWVFSGGGNRQRYIRANQLQINAETRNDRTRARDRVLSCWRRETPQKLANDGTPIGLELDLSGLTLQSLPDLDVDFSHVGSLKLSNMNLSTSPEGFLTRFRHVRWLNLSHNQLRELPPALGEMNGLTRLFLQNNQLSLTSHAARVLSERTTLRALWLHENPQLGITPDFSQIPDIRSVDLSNTGIETFPTGLSEQPLLDTINLSGNRISTIPDSVIAPPDERLAQTARVNNITNITGNRLSETDRGRLISYIARLVDAGIPMTGANNLFVTSSRTQALPVSRIRTDDQMARWTLGLSADQVSARRVQWQTLHAQQGSDGLFNTLERLLQDPAGHGDLQRRVWNVIDSITENTLESERLRRELFDRAGQAACCDRAAFTFSNLETRTLMHQALAQARDQTQGRQLSELSRGLFRLHEVDKIASADIAQSEARINDPRVSQGEEDHHHNRLTEEVEIRLAYRYGLKSRLQLPGQPERVKFTFLGSVSAEKLEAAYQKIVALDNSPEEFQALVAREFWQEFVTHKYRAQFEARRQPFQERMATLDESLAAKALPFADYEAQAKALQTSLAIDEAALIETLTRQELSEQSLIASGEEAEAEAEAEAEDS